MNNLTRKAIAECFGTFFLVFLSCGTAAVTRGSVVPTSLAFGITLTLLCYIIGPISGCHVNPAVSIAMLMSKKMSVKEFFVYIASQLVGGILGALILYSLLKITVSTFASPSNMITGGIHVLKNGEERFNIGGLFGSLIIEILLTFIFVYVILRITSKKNDDKKNIQGLIIGLALCVVHLLGIYFTGTSVNPARSIATAISDAIFNKSFEALKVIYVFIVGPLLGGVLASVIDTSFNNEVVEDTKIEE
jgi:aquaporin Z